MFATTKDIPATILALERAALDRSDRGDAIGFLEISDPGVTYFDPFLEQPIHSLEELRAYYLRGFSADEPYAGEMRNAKVQVAGETAVLTFNYISKGQRSGREVRWNATEVYHRTEAGWRIIHTHWAFLKPQV
ncbi:MAG TPA: nuclear transport factor 2 family protein [Bryobacteraceae bacterium]|nr:nuclear transport factor 2 family protein [Bryobacteraceae bacterium]